MLTLIQQALRRITNPYFFALEESYQGELLAEIRTLLPGAGLPGDAIIQQEYQKNWRSTESEFDPTWWCMFRP